jgi:hypothetical protein
MKKLFLLLVTATAATAYAQQTRWQGVSYADPAVTSLQFNDAVNGNGVNTDMLTIGTPVIQIP